MISAARRLEILKYVVRSFWDLSTQNRRGGKLKWKGFLRSKSAVQALLNGIDNVRVIETSKSKEIPLHWAAYLGFRELVTALLESKVVLEQPNEARETALHLAAQNGSTEVLEVLQKASANLEVQDKGGRTVLHHAALNGRLEVVKLLLMDTGQMLIGMTDRNGFTALHLAAHSGEAEVVKMLLDFRPSVATQGTDVPPNALYLAVRSGNLDVVNVLLKAGFHTKYVHVGDNGATALHVAAKHNHPTVVRVLLEAHADVAARDFSGNSALHLAARNGHREIVMLLLEAGAKASQGNTNGESPRQFAARFKHHDVEDILKTHTKRKASTSGSGLFKFGKKRV